MMKGLTLVIGAGAVAAATGIVTALAMDSELYGMLEDECDNCDDCDGCEDCDGCCGYSCGPCWHRPDDGESDDTACGCVVYPEDGEEDDLVKCGFEGCDDCDDCFYGDVESAAMCPDDIEQEDGDDLDDPDGPAGNAEIILI